MGANQNNDGKRRSCPPVGIVGMRFAVKRLEATRDRINPLVALTRSVDANLDELRAWRQGRAAKCSTVK
jgi:hypothetical protein